MTKKDRAIIGDLALMVTQLHSEIVDLMNYCEMTELASKRTIEMSNLTKMFTKDLVED